MLELLHIGAREVLEDAPFATAIVDAGGRILFWNQAATTLFGYASPEIIGKSIEALVPEQRRASHNGNVTQWFRHPKPRRMGSGLNIEARHKDGSDMRVEIELSTIHTEAGVVAIAWIVPK